MVKVGNVYDRLTVLQLVRNQAKCLCVCGKICETYTWCLKSGNNRSCGCLRKERVREMGKKNALTEEDRSIREKFPFKCAACHTVKKPEAFDYHARRRIRFTVCRECRKLTCHRYRKRHPERVKISKRNAVFKGKYNLSVDQHADLLKNQKGVCAICFAKPGNRELSVDHCHKSKKVRGLLCPHCNSMLGMARDDLQILQSAIQYLIRFENHAVGEL